jgi:shikimate dehydrogenase
MAGAGGVAQAIAPALLELGAEKVTVWDTEPDRAQALAARLGARVTAVVPDAIGAAIHDADGLVNATAVGMAYVPGSPIDTGSIGGQRWAFDAVYTPTNTVFLSAAAQAGLETISGFAFFQHMAIRSFATYTGIQPETDKTLAKLAVLEPD